MRDEKLYGPEELLRLSPSDADRLLTRLEREVPSHPSVIDLGPARPPSALVFGDSHGDWRTIVEVVRRWRAAKGALLVGLGDYVDRTPADCPNGSVANALYLLQWVAREPNQVVLIRGNHETVREIPVVPHSLRREVESLWGPDASRYERLVSLLNRGPLAATTASGAYLAHGGFPREPRPTPWTVALEHPELARLEEVVWADCAASQIRRGAVPVFESEELVRFLADSGCSFMIRGHDPDLARRSVYEGRCLTLHTTRYYARYGGVVFARLPLASRVASSLELTIEELPT